MPIHDWKKVPSGLFHDFHHAWCFEIKQSLNAGRLPHGYTAMVEQRSSKYIADVLAIEGTNRSKGSGVPKGGTATLERPKTQYTSRSDRQLYAGRANRIAIKHHLGRTVAVIEVVSPGNKDSKMAMCDFVEKSVGLIESGIHLLIIDLFPPTSRCPEGLHKLIWDEILEEPFELGPGKDRLCASYEAAAERACYVETFGVGDKLPDMPLFIMDGVHVKVPLESTYMQTWEHDCPEVVRQVVETGVLPSFDEDNED